MINNILYKYQPGFRRNHSTDTCLSYLNDKILNGFDQGKITGMILIDLQKAFDTINHKVLLGKLVYLGFSETAILWFKSYLSNWYHDLASTLCFFVNFAAMHIRYTTQQQI